MKKCQDLYFGETLKEVVMKSWIRRFALLAVMGSVVGGVVMTGCSTPPAEEETNVEVDPAAPPVDAEPPVPETPPAE